MQMQCMEFKTTHFCEYRPEGPWNAEEFTIHTVPRDDEWFEDNFPAMEEFYTEWMVNKAAGVVYPEIKRTKKLQITWEETLAHVNTGEYMFIPTTEPRLDVVTYPTGSDDEFCDCPKIDRSQPSRVYELFDDTIDQQDGQCFGGAMML